MKVFQDAYRLIFQDAYVHEDCHHVLKAVHLNDHLPENHWGCHMAVVLILFEGLKAGYTTRWKLCTQSFNERHPLAILDSNRESLSFSILHMSQLQPHDLCCGCSELSTQNMNQFLVNVWRHVRWCQHKKATNHLPKLRYLGSILRLVPCGWLPPVSGNHWDRTLAWASMPPEDSDQKHVFFLCTKFQSKILYTSFNKNWPFFLSWSHGNLGFSQLPAMTVVWKTPCQELARGDICSIDGLKVVVGW